MGLFKRKKVEESTKIPAVEKIIFEQILEDDERAKELVDELQLGKPLVLNFEKLDLLGANKYLAFFAGASYASSGKSIKINETTYLFAKNVEFNDGTLNEFLNDFDDK